jgi:uncharacterized protein YjeT (DUF2065 family)
MFEEGVIINVVPRAAKRMISTLKLVAAATTKLLVWLVR